MGEWQESPPRLCNFITDADSHPIGLSFPNCLLDGRDDSGILSAAASTITSQWWARENTATICSVNCARFQNVNKEITLSRFYPYSLKSS
ncbi:unnamed protein product [Clavelina lepadiformis]|uniref:Uncharacterized protein n=1 Tax=Clavelina lepadiformis TaxID=159417 RepID=A0ABP0FD25_CLALP